jgi:hypothetical protein
MLGIKGLLAQTRMEPEQAKYAPGPAVQGVDTLGNHTQFGIGAGLTLTATPSGATLINAVAAGERPDTQQLVLEPDNTSWRVPVPISKPQIYRNGLRMLLTKDYTLEVDPVSNRQVIRPTVAQKMKTTDTWLAC